MPHEDHITALHSTTIEIMVNYSPHYPFSIPFRAVVVFQRVVVSNIHAKVPNQERVNIDKKLKMRNYISFVTKKITLPFYCPESRLPNTILFNFAHPSKKTHVACKNHEKRKEQL